ncbi:MAG: hypothetical protein R3B35_12325 [Gemmatimonadales bacterium]
MQAKTRRILSMVSRVLAFEAARPSDDPSHVAVVDALTALTTRIPDLVEAENAGRRRERQATARRRELREGLLVQARHLDRVAEIATQTTPELAGSFAFPARQAPNRTFLAGMRSLLPPLQQHLDLLLASGLGRSFVEDLEAGLAAFAAASDESGASRNAHVDARSSLLAVAEQCRDLVGVLDGLNAARYAKTPERLAAWESARNVYGPVNRSSGSDADADVATPEAPATTTPPADEAVA